MVAYDWTQHHKKLDKAKRYKMARCSQKDLELIPDAAKVYYSKSICFANAEQIVFRDNWLAHEYHIPYITINHCDSSKRKCKSYEESRKFL